MSILTFVLLGLLIVLAVRLDVTPDPRQLAGAVRVHDGDTLTVSGERVRLQGIDAPEFDQTCVRRGVGYPCGRQARDALAALVTNRSVACEGWRRDRYRRLLVVCKAGAADVNGALVGQGWAVAYGGYEAQEASARAASRGLWAGEFDQPSDWRARAGKAAEEPHDLVRSLIDLLRETFGFS